MIEPLHEKTVFEERVLNQGSEIQRKQVLNRELGELIMRRKSLIAELAGINSRIGIVEKELNPPKTPPQPEHNIFDPHEFLKRFREFADQPEILDEANIRDREQGYRTVATAPAYKYLVQ